MKFLHLSDLHFTTAAAGTQFDYDLKIREGLLADLGKDGRTDFKGILVTGDVAYHGRSDEFSRATAWLEEVRKAVGSQPEAIFVVPGNHDVNREFVGEGSSLWALHQMLREQMPHAARSASLDQKLRDPWDFLAAQKEYRAFAAEHECSTIVGNLAWSYVLEEKLEDGTQVRLHGLNSALLCDDRDAKANLLLGDCQFHQFDARPEFVNVVLCHHPWSWLLDGNEANDYFRNQAHLVLTGHEHDTRCYQEGGSLRMMAGAVHPNRREPKWEPCYHVLDLTINGREKRELVIKVETRIWMPKDLVFGPASLSGGGRFFEHRINLVAWAGPSSQISSKSASLSSVPFAAPVPTVSPSSSNPEAFATARRRLIVHFFRLGMISRYETVISAGVWQDSDDAYDGQAKWARVFERAEKEQKLSALWNAVASKDETLAGQSNPFTSPA